MTKKWKITLDPEDGSEARYDVILPLDDIGVDAPSFVGFIEDTLDQHQWVDPATTKVHSARVVVILTSESGEEAVLDETYPVSDDDRDENYEDLGLHMCADIKAALK